MRRSKQVDVVAGIVGTKRFLYDIWGDTVNVASRMESSGIGGHIQVSKDLVDLIKARGEFEFRSRGEIPIKGKGNMETFLLLSRKCGRDLFFDVSGYFDVTDVVDRESVTEA